MNSNAQFSLFASSHTGAARLVTRMVDEGVLDASVVPKLLGAIMRVAERGRMVVQILGSGGYALAIDLNHPAWECWFILPPDRPIVEARPDEEPVSPAPKAKSPRWARLARHLILPQHCEAIVGDLLERRDRLLAAGQTDRWIRWRLIYPDLLGCGALRLCSLGWRLVKWASVIAGAEWIKSKVGRP